MDNMAKVGQMMAELSAWIDAANVEMDPTAQLFARTSVKIAEELGEVSDALIGLTGQNPRKGTYGSEAAVIKELLDVALTALCAVEFMIGNTGGSMAALSAHTAATSIRAFPTEMERLAYNSAYGKTSMAEPPESPEI